MWLVTQSVLGMGGGKPTGKPQAEDGGGMGAPSIQMNVGDNIPLKYIALKRSSNTRPLMRSFFDKMRDHSSIQF